MATLERDGTLVTALGHRFAQLKPSASMFLNRSTVIYGPSGSGKTVIVKNIMYLLKPHVDNGLVISPSEPSNQSYRDCMRRPLTHYEIYAPDASGQRKKDEVRAGAIRFLEAFWNRAEMMASTHARASNPQVLCSLYGRLSSQVRQPIDAAIARMNATRQQMVKRLRATHGAESSLCVQKTREVNDRTRQWLVRVYRETLARYARDLAALELSEDEAFCLKYARFNPCQLIVFDDCADQLKPLFRNEIFRKLFYRGRHNYITIVICCQDDTDLDTNLRKNAFVSFYTRPQVATSNFSRASNHYPKPMQKLVSESVDELFSQDHEHKHRKLAYIREDPNNVNFYHVTFRHPPSFMFGSQAVHDLCDAVEATETSVDRSNPFYNSFHPSA